MSAELLGEVVRLSADPKHKLKFVDLYEIGAGATSWPDEVDQFSVMEARKKEMARRREVFGEQTGLLSLPTARHEKILGVELNLADAESHDLRQSPRKKFATQFDERQKLQLREIDAQIEKLRELKARIQERATRKDKEVEAMLIGPSRGDGLLGRMTSCPGIVWPIQPSPSIVLCRAR